MINIIEFKFSKPFLLRLLLYFHHSFYIRKNKTNITFLKKKKKFNNMFETKSSGNIEIRYQVKYNYIYIYIYIINIIAFIRK
jgi:hypothetical protein